jgi:hypothetical protein
MFHGHVRIERCRSLAHPRAADGSIGPDLSRLGFGLEAKRADAGGYAM